MQIPKPLRFAAAFLLLGLLGGLPASPASLRAAELHSFYLMDGTQLQGELLSLDEDGLLISTAFSDSLRVPMDQVAALLLKAELADLQGAGDPGFYLVDGTQLQGKLLRLDGRDLVVATAFSDALKVPFDQVAAIVLEPGVLDLEPAAANSPAPALAIPELLLTAPKPEIPAGRGNLEITIKGQEIRSSVRYKNKSDVDRMKTLVTLHMRIYVDGNLIHEESDAKIEKEYRRDTWRFLRNKHRFPPVELDIPSGYHRLQIVVGNDLGLLEAGEEHSDLVSAELFVEDLAVMPDEKTRVVIEGKGSRIGYGSYNLTLLSSR